MHAAVDPDPFRPPPSPSVVRRPVLGPTVATGVLAAGALVLHLVDPTGGPPLCPFHAATGLWCPGCGSTRMLHRLAVGDPVGAFGYNPLAFLVLPLALYWFFAGVTAAAGGPALATPRFDARAVRIFAGVLLLYWVVRNLPMAPFTALAP